MISDNEIDQMHSVISSFPNDNINESLMRFDYDSPVVVVNQQHTYDLPHNLPQQPPHVPQYSSNQSMKGENNNNSSSGRPASGTPVSITSNVSAGAVTDSTVVIQGKAHHNDNIMNKSSNAVNKLFNQQAQQPQQQQSQQQPQQPQPQPTVPSNQQQQPQPRVEVDYESWVGLNNFVRSLQASHERLQYEFSAHIKHIISLEQRLASLENSSRGSGLESPYEIVLTNDGSNPTNLFIDESSNIKFPYLSNIFCILDLDDNTLNAYFNIYQLRIPMQHHELDRKFKIWALAKHIGCQEIGKYWKSA